MIEWFSITWLKTKPKVITLADHKGHRQYSEPIKTLRNYMQSFFEVHFVIDSCCLVSQ